MVSGYAPPASSCGGGGLAPAGEVNARPETKADSIVVGGKPPGAPPSPEVVEPKKDLFGITFGSSKALLAKVRTPCSRAD